MNGNRVSSMALWGSTLIASAFAGVVLIGPAAAAQKVPVTEWQQTDVGPVSPYLLETGRALNVGSGVEWRHLMDDSGRIFVEYRTGSGRVFISGIYDPIALEQTDIDDDEE